MANFGYIRTYYHVPAEKGVQVIYTGDREPKRGVIVGSTGHGLLIRLDGEKHTRPYHPTWEITYLVGGAELWDLGRDSKMEAML